MTSRVFEVEGSNATPWDGTGSGALPIVKLESLVISAHRICMSDYRKKEEKGAYSANIACKLRSTKARPTRPTR